MPSACRFSLRQFDASRGYCHESSMDVDQSRSYLFYSFLCQSTGLQYMVLMKTSLIATNPINLKQSLEMHLSMSLILRHTLPSQMSFPLTLPLKINQSPFSFSLPLKARGTHTSSLEGETSGCLVLNSTLPLRSTFEEAHTNASYLVSLATRVLQCGTPVKATPAISVGSNQRKSLSQYHIPTTVKPSLQQQHNPLTSPSKCNPSMNTSS
jgi:hypothetical protein